MPTKTANENKVFESEIVLGMKFNSVVPRHELRRLGPGYTPFMQNVRPNYGVIEKQHGYTKVFDAPAKILGRPHMIGGDFLLFGCANGKMYAWDLGMMPTHADWTDPDDWDTGTDGVALVGSGYEVTRDDGTDADWFFTDYYDANLGLCVVCTNGMDEPVIFNRTTELMEAISWEDETITSARFVGNRKGALYFSYVNITGAPYAGGNPFLTVWSQTFDGRDFSYSKRHQLKTDDGSYINGMIKFGEHGLIIGKADENMYSVGAYGRFDDIETSYGFTSPNGQFGHDDVYFNWNGHLRSLFSKQWVSQPVHNLFSADSPANWAKISGIRDRSTNSQVWSSGHQLWTLDKNQNTWFMDDYATKDVQVVADMPPYLKFLDSWPEYLDEMTQILAEYDIISDIIFKIGENAIVRRDPSYDNDGGDITMIYDFPWFDYGRPDLEKTYHKMMLIGEADGEIELHATFGDYPDHPPYLTKYDAQEFDSRGKLVFDIGERYRNATFRLYNSDQSKVKITNAFIYADIEKNTDF